MRKKGLSVLLAVCLMMTLIPFSVSATASNDYTQWRQGDPEWNKEAAWPKDEFTGADYQYMSQAGCLVTSIAMLLRHYNVVTDSNVNHFNPWICNEQLKAVKAFDNNADLDFGKVELAYPGFQYEGSAGYSEARLISLYNQGYACIVKVKSPNNWHFVAVRSASNSGIVIMDPGWGYTSLSSFSRIDSIYYYKTTNSPPPTLTEPTYATLSTNNFSYAVDERVYFTISADGNVNNLWIYCPNGETLTYSDVGNSYYLPFGMKGHYQALVQTWNSYGSYTSDRIDFVVGPPTYATIKTDYTSYHVDEEVTFTMSSDGNLNSLWVYCPNGETITRSDVGSSYTLAFGMKGHYQALVQTWNGQGSFTSDRIDFVIGPPTYATLKTDKTEYLAGETVTFTNTSDGDTSTLWVMDPNGKNKYYEHIDPFHKMTFDQPGNYSAYIESWNGVGALRSEKVYFSIVDPADIVSLSFDLNGGEYPDASELEYANSKKVNINQVYGNLPIPVKAGYVFGGWTADDGTIVEYDTPYMSSSLKAIWLTDKETVPADTLEYNGHLYELFDYHMSWQEAKEFCERHGGYLTVINDADEQKAMSDLINSHDSYIYYIGCTDEQEQGNWTWVNGDSFTYNNWDPQFPEPDPGEGFDYGGIVNKAIGPNKQHGEWLANFNRSNEVNGKYRVCNYGFICEYDTIVEPEPVNPFTDVPEGKFYYDPVLWAISQDPQITTGVTKTTFEPDRVCTRAHVVTFLWRANGCPEPKSTTNPFPDVPDGKYYTKAVLWASEQGITTGYDDGTFRPDAECTRGQVVTFLWRANGSPKPELTTNPFVDVSPSAYYYQAVLWARENGITDGRTPTTFGPTDACTRGHVVTFLYRAYA